MSDAWRQAPEGDFWVITTYFNPAGYASRLANYHVFRRSLAMPLLTVEATFGGPGALGAHDADILLRCTDGDVMWQKERLINHGLSRLPASCKYVAWIDCDVVFESPDWAARARQALSRATAVQLFSELNHLPRGASPGDGGAEHRGWTQPGAIASIVASSSPQAMLSAVMERAPGAPSPGMAWAVHRDWLQEHGLYDRCVIGGGDTAFACALLGHAPLAAELHAMNGAQKSTYEAWAKSVHGARLAHVPGRVHHLWHGDLRHRQARQRHVKLAATGFDPAVDLRHGEGAWQWATDKPALHAVARDYFASRHEDT